MLYPPALKKSAAGLAESLRRLHPITSLYACNPARYACNPASVKSLHLLRNGALRHPVGVYVWQYCTEGIRPIGVSCARPNTGLETAFQNVMTFHACRTCVELEHRERASARVLKANSTRHPGGDVNRMLALTAVRIKAPVGQRFLRCDMDPERVGNPGQGERDSGMISNRIPG
jgi:hypothetical protein